MDVKNLQFFDYNGYNLNFDWNEKFKYWEGVIYLPKVSVGLYTNTTIYVLEKFDSAPLENMLDESTIDLTVDGQEFDYSIFNNSFVFPVASKKGDEITFKWDRLNKFVDEFFMFNFDETYILKETSALIYTPNDGPEGNTLIINRFDEYSIPLDFNYVSKALPIHIAFMANEKYDATTYVRTLNMYYNNQVIAKIRFYAETVEEDERLKIWNDNLGYNITPEDTMIFYKSDIKEYRPDYILLNEKRKELMMEGSNIYPYIGSYKAIINAIKFFGYENLNIIEYWRNVNQNDENFGKIYHSSKYSLTHKETLRIGNRNIILPNKDYKKINALALVYSINKPTGKIDEWELPLVKETFTYTIEEALIKLFALRNKLNKEFMPGTSRIIDIIGEGNYFGIQGLRKVRDTATLLETYKELSINFDIYPSKYGHITDNTYFARYINYIKQNEDSDLEIPIQNQILSDITDTTLNTISNESLESTEESESALLLDKLAEMSNYEKCEYYKEYYREVFVDQTIYKSILDNDDYPYENEEYDYTDPDKRFSAKYILSCPSFEYISFGECELLFKTYQNDQFGDKEYLNDITFGNIDTVALPDTIKWTVTMSKNQYDEDLKNIGVMKEYTHDFGNSDSDEDFILTSGVQNIAECREFFVELPYIGYYDVTLELGYSYDETKKQIKTKRKCIKVEPYQIELLGFYYDARQLPENMQYVANYQMTEFIKNSLKKMHGWAKAERTTTDLPIDTSMPYTTTDGINIIPGPYVNKNVENEWYLTDNVTYEMAELKPLLKYTRYIRNGVDVKPYTWFLLGYEYTKIAGKIKPSWSITNKTTGEEIPIPGSENKKYLTLLLKKEGNYTVNLKLEDKHNNKYEISRNIIVVDKTANYKLYQTFKKDYDYMSEQDLLKEMNEVLAHPAEESAD